jgi:hypothetical protein
MVRFRRRRFVEIRSGRISNRGFFVHHERVPGHPVDQVWGSKMRKGALLILAALLAVSFSSTADAARKKKAAAAPKPAATATNPNQNTVNFMNSFWTQFQPKPAAPAPAKKKKRA